jgi:hypothetical protein
MIWDHFEVNAYKSNPNSEVAIPAELGCERLFVCLCRRRQRTRASRHLRNMHLSKILVDSGNAGAVCLRQRECRRRLSQVIKFK